MTIEELFQKNLYTLPQLTQASEKEKQEFLRWAEQEIMERVAASVSLTLADEEFSQFTNLLSSKNSEPRELTDFLNAHVPEFERIFLEEALQFKEDIIGAAEKIEKK
jgi:hypothetical protein